MFIFEEYSCCKFDETDRVNSFFILNVLVTVIKIWQVPHINLFLENLKQNENNNKNGKIWQKERKTIKPIKYIKIRDVPHFC